MRVPAEVGEDLLPPLGHRGQGGHQEPAQGDDDGHDDGVGDGDDDDYDGDDNEDSASALEVEIDDSSEKIIFYVYDATFAKKVCCQYSYASVFNVHAYVALLS